MIRIKRIYDPAEAEDGKRVLVDRLWPRGVSREKAQLTEWAKELAPSEELRRLYHSGGLDWVEFQKRYEAELDDKAEALRSLVERCRNRPLTLLYASSDPDHNHAAILLDRLLRAARD